VAAIPTFPELPTLRSDLLSLRQITSADAASVAAIFGDPLVARYMGIPLIRSDRQLVQLLDDIANGLREKTLFQWGISLGSAPGLVGTCTLAHISWPNERAELGFALASSRWGQGLMRQALPVLLDWAFTDLGLHRIEADVDPRNDRSLRLLERLGFEREGYLRERHVVAGERQDTVLLGLLAHQWRRLDGASEPGHRTARTG
jgi:[ribosomal protein S5]-alanine N-acetyltransferase